MNYRFEDFTIDYNDLKGKGTYGDVFGCLLKNQPNVKAVVKICEVQIEQREIDILNQLAKSVHFNENIVKVYTICKLNSKIYIFMEECKKDLKRMLNKKKVVSEQEALLIIKHIANGYYALYQENVIHRDIKPANILIKDNIYKLSDFGEGKIMNNISEKLHQTIKGTPAYQSPQLLSCFDGKAQATNKLDIFSLGLIFYELIVGELPYDYPVNQYNINKFNIEIGKTPFDFYKSLKNKQTRSQPPPIPDRTAISQQVAELINRMLKYNESDRISWEEFFDHELIKIEQKKKFKSEPSQQSTLDSIGSQEHQKQESPTMQIKQQRLTITTNQVPCIIHKPIHKSIRFQTNAAQNQPQQNQIQTQFQGQFQNQNNNQLQNQNQSTKKQNISVIRTQKELIEFVQKLKQKAAELAFLPLFTQIPFNKGPLEVKNYLIKNQYDIQIYLPYDPQQAYTVQYLYIVACFYKIARNENIPGEWNNEAQLTSYLNSLIKQFEEQSK